MNKSPKELLATTLTFIATLCFITAGILAVLFAWMYILPGPTYEKIPQEKPDQIEMPYETAEGKG